MTKQSGDNKSREELLDEIEQLRVRLGEAEQTLEAIRSGDVDALVVAGPHGDQIFSLTGAESIYRLIYETMNEAALTVSLDGTILFCNRRFCELMKSPMEDCVGSKLARFVAPAQLHPLRNLLADATSGPFLRHITLRAADGSSVSMQIAVSTILNDANISICLLATDLSELELQAGSIATMIKQQQALEEKQAELEEANASLRNSRLAALNLMQDAVESRHQLEESTRSLQRAHDELEQRVTERTMDLEIAVETIQTEIAERLKVMEELRMQEQMLLQQSRLAAMGEMINNIAHQWRQPLNALGLLVQKLPIYYDSAEFNREFLEENTVKSMKLIQHMSQTINDFRDFFRSDKEMVAFNLDSVVRQAVAFIEQNFRDLDIKIDLDTEQGLMVKGYPNEFAQALLNILMNACDALVGNNTADARIILRTFEDNGSAVVTVTDNAGGIPGEVIDRVFDPYFTTKGPDKGTGLGLFMSKTIIEKNMAGRLTVRNTGNGAEFRIEVAHDDK